MNNSKGLNREQSPNECLSYDEFANYSSGRLKGQKRVRIENHLRHCELCNEALEGYANISDHRAAERAIDTINLSVKRKIRSKSVRKFHWMRYAAAALIFVGLVAVFQMLTGPDLNGELFEQNFKPYPNTVPIVRGQQNNDQLVLAMQQYELENFQPSYEKLVLILNNDNANPTANFYAGICLLELDQAELAIGHFQKVLTSSKNSFISPAKWYLALAHIKNKNNKKAKLILKQIVKRGDDYRKSSEIILKKLESDK